MANPRDVAEQAFALLQNALQESETRAAELDAQLKRKRPAKNQLEEQLDVLTHRLEIVEAERARSAQESDQLSEIAEAERAKVAQLKKKLEIAESGPDKLTKREVNFWRGRAETFDTETQDHRNRLAELRKQLLERDAQIEKLTALADAAESAAAPAVDAGEIDALRHAEAEARAAAERAEADASAAVEHAESETRAVIERAQTEARAAVERAETDARIATERVVLEARIAAERTAATLEERERRIVELSAAVGQAQAESTQSAERERGMAAAVAERDRLIAGLETELKDEKTHAENLNEIANERRERITKLEEQVDEATERYEEAKWRLGKTQHFERLVKRRKGLISKLLAALRTKSKANTALKAGLDGLRTFKAAIEANQQKLIARLEAQKGEIKEARAAIARQQQAAAARNDEVVAAAAHGTELETRLRAQSELIAALEGDLKTAKAEQKAGANAAAEVARLAQQLDAKTAAIAKLEADVDEQQRKLAKLRGSESETVRLNAAAAKDREALEALEREVAELRTALALKDAGEHSPDAGSDDAAAALQAALKERDRSITQLQAAIKEHESTIKKLTEATDGWRRKYEFLATDAPAPYQTAGMK